MASDNSITDRTPLITDRGSPPTPAKSSPLNALKHSPARDPASPATKSMKAPATAPNVDNDSTILTVSDSAVGNSRQLLEFGSISRTRQLHHTDEQLVLSRCIDRTKNLKIAIDIAVSKADVLLPYLDRLEINGLKRLNKIYKTTSPSIFDFPGRGTFEEIIASLESISVEEGRNQLSIESFLHLLKAASEFRIGIRTAQHRLKALREHPTYPADLSELGGIPDMRHLEKSLVEWMREIVQQCTEAYSTITVFLIKVKEQTKTMEEDNNELDEALVAKWRNGSEEERSGIVVELFKTAMSEKVKPNLNRKAFERIMREIRILACLFPVEMFCKEDQAFETGIPEARDRIKLSRGHAADLEM